MEMELEEWQMEVLSRPTENTMRLIIEFYSNPETYEAFRKWCIETYGNEPNENCIVEIESKRNRERILEERVKNESKTRNNKQRNMGN